MKTKMQEKIDLYNSGISCTKLAKIYNTTVYKMIKELKASGCKIWNKQNEIKYDIKDILDDYKTGRFSANDLAKKYNLSASVILKWLHKYSLTIQNKQNKTKFNENIFDTIDTEEKAYWLGFIFADGYISNNSNKFELSLSLKDKEHLEKFNKFMKHENNNVKCDSFRCRWSISNKHLKEKLIFYGCVPRKSLTLNFPNVSIFKNKHLIIHFIRGYFDGDGCLCISKNMPRISVLGTKDFLTEINKFLLNDYCKLTKNHKSEKTFVWGRGTTKAIAISYMLYYKSNVYLKRKYHKFLQFQNCRFKAKALKLLEGKIGEGWDVNEELVNDIKNGTILL